MPFFRRTTVDPALRSQLLKRGLDEELRRLEETTEDTSTIGQFPGQFKQKFLGFANATKSIGTGLGAKAVQYQTVREAAKLQEDTDARQAELTRGVAKRLRDPNATVEEKRKLTKLLGEVDTDIFDDIPELKFTEKQIAGDAVSLALLATSGLKLGLNASATGKLISPQTVKALGQLQQYTKAMSAAERVARYGKAGKVINAVLARGVPMTKDAIIGALGFGASKASMGGSAEEIKKSAKIGAVVGVALPLAFEGVIRGTQALGRATSKYVTKPLGEKIVSGLQSAAAGTSADEQYADEVGRTLAHVGEKSTLKQRTAAATLRAIEGVKSIPQKMYDRFYPVSRIQTRLEETLGRPLTEAEKVYRDFRLAQPTAEGRAENMLTGFFDDFKQYDDIDDAVRARIVKLDLLDRARLGQKVAGGESADDLAAGLERLVKEAGDENPRIDAAVSAWNKFHRKLLQERVDAGLISSETMRKLLETHPNYMPHNVLLDLDEEIAGGFGASGSMNVSSTDIKKAFGSLRDIDDPYVAMTQRTPVATQLIEKNKALRGLVEVQEQFDVVPGMERVTGAERLKQGEQTINLFRDGVKETWKVPKDVAVAVKNLDYEPLSRLMRFMTAPNRLLKKFATQYNVSFTIPNLLRDRQTAAVTADAFIKGLADNSDAVVPGATHSQDDLYRLWKESGGAFGSVFREGEPSKEVLEQLTKSGFWSKVDDTVNPVTLIDKMNKSIEESTRLKVFEQALGSGLSPKDAAFASREATVDFAKMGTFMRQLNQVVPFLNARVQGMANTFRALGADPNHFGRIMTWTAVYPTMALQNHNRQFKSYRNIPQYFKDNYWNIVVDEVDTIDDDGEPVTIPQFISIKKGEAQALVANPLQHFLDKSDDLDYRTTTQMLADTLGNASPVNFSTYDSKNPWLSMLASFGPLANIPTGLATNIDPFSGYKIVPESRTKLSPALQYKDTTPDIIKDIAGSMGVSPAKVAFVLGAFGGVPQDAVALTEIGYDVSKGRGLDIESESGTPFGTAANLPLLRRFFREASPDRGPERQMQQEKVQEMERTEADRSFLQKQRLRDIYAQMVRLPTAEEREDFLRLQNLTKDEVKQMKQIKRSSQTVEALSTTTDSDVRAQYILWRIDEMKAAGVPTEVRIAFLKELEEKKILTAAVRKKMEALKALTR